MTSAERVLRFYYRQWLRAEAGEHRRYAWRRLLVYRRDYEDLRAWCRERGVPQPPSASFVFQHAQS